MAGALSQMPKVHPAVDVVADTLKAWLPDGHQAHRQAYLIVRALADAGILKDVEMFHGTPCVAGAARENVVG